MGTTHTCGQVRRLESWGVQAKGAVKEGSRDFRSTTCVLGVQGPHTVP